MTNMTLFQQSLGGTQIALSPEMQQMMQSGDFGAEMTQGVGPSYAVVSIKGRQWAIKHGGQTVPLTVDYNGQIIAAPSFDVVLVRAKGEMSKTFYKDGYTDGSDDQPTCWSEDGVTPLAPVAQRPIDPVTGTHCTNCAMCPANAFGSRKVFNPGSQGEGKACADTRKVVILPLGADQRVDAQNIRFGGAMLLRVPAASLKVFAEYSNKLAAMGLPYMSVVTRMTFDNTVAYPKIDLQPVRALDPAEASEVMAAYNGLQVKQILEQGHTAQATAPAPALPPPAAAAPASAPTPPAPSNVVPITAAAPTPAAPAAAPTPPAPPAPVAAAPAPVPPPAAVWPPVGWTQHPDAAGFFYKGNEVLAEADLRARVAPPAPVAAPPAPPVPPAPPAAPVAAAAPVWPPVGWTPHPDAAGFFYKGNEVLAEADLRARVAQPAPVAASPAPAAIVPPVGGAVAGAVPAATDALLGQVDALLGPSA